MDQATGVTMSFVLSHQFVKEVRAMSPFKPIIVSGGFYDDDSGRMAQLQVIHRLEKPHRFVMGKTLTILVDVYHHTTKKDVLGQIRKKMLYWHKLKRTK